MPKSNIASADTIAPLSNVSLFAALLDRLVEAPPTLPRIGTFYGPSGFGKTFSATYGATLYSAGYVEFGESWTKRRFLQALCIELGVDTSGTNSTLSDRIVEALARSPRPMIVDEADIAVRKGCLELIREIHDKANSAWVMIGEEKLPSVLAATSERFHNRILAHQAAQPVTIEDTAHLARLICREVEVDPALLRRILDVSHGRVRRVVVNLDGVREVCATNGLQRIDIATWGSRELYTGLAPATRRIAG